MLEPKSLYRRIESLLDLVPVRTSAARFADHLAPLLLDNLGPHIECFAAQVYERRPTGWLLGRAWGEPVSSLAGLLPHEPSLPDGEFPRLEGAHGLVVVGGSVLALHFVPGTATRTYRMMLLSALQHAAAQHLRRRELEDQMDQARAIQTSLLPAAPPPFCDFDIAARSVAAQSVGGDALDFLPLDSETLEFAVLDAAGHGLPAALQARDVIIGLRMGMERELKLSRMVERLNRVINQSGLASRFVSLVIGELESNGGISYVNAGHPPPLLLGKTGISELTTGGMVLGPWAESRYKLGFAHLDRGGTLVVYTDGVLEHGTSRGDAFGAARLHRWLGECRDGSAESALVELFARLRSVGGPEPFEDDVSVVIVRRPIDAGELG